MNIGDLFDSPWKILIIAGLLIVFFGSKKLPHAARSLGQSMRILKKEVQGLHGEEADSKEQAQGPEAQSQVPQAQLAAASAGPADQQSQIDALQQQIRDMQRASAMDTPPANATVPAEPQRTQPS